MHDTIIRSGRVFDGTGSPPSTADVAISDGTITAVGRVDGPARRVIHADGAIVTPGLVDVHTHYDGQFLWDDKLDPSFSNGVTTVVAGNCGVGFAPAHAEHHQMLIDLMEGVEDIPGIALAEGLDWEWKSFPDYLNRLSSRSYAMDVSAHIGHSPLRVFVMGDRALRHEPATEVDVENMAQLVTEAMEAGAMGLSVARFRGHRASTGEQQYGIYAERSELLALAGAMGRTGLGVFEIVPHGVAGDIYGKAGADRSERLAEHELFVDIARHSGRPVTYLCEQFPSDPGDWRFMLAASDNANKAGLRIHPQVAARGIGALVLLDGYHHFMLRPSYMEIAHLPLERRAEALRDSRRRAAILSEEDTTPTEDATKWIFATYKSFFPTVYLVSPPFDYEPAPEMRLHARAAATGRSMEELLYDHLTAGKGDNMAVGFALNYENGNLDGVREMLSNPHVISGLGDAGAHVKVVCDGALPSFQLSFWSRDRSRGPKLPLEYIVRKATFDCATLYGFNDRGVIAPGKRADINVIDFDRLRLESPQLLHDLPSGGSRLVQKSLGYLATLVAGIPTRENDEDTGARPGKLVRSTALK